MLLLLSASCLFSTIYQMYYYVLSLNEKTGKVLIIFIFTGLLNIILNVVLIPKMGILGAAISTGIAFLFQGIYTKIESDKINKFRVIRWDLLKICIVISAILLLFYKIEIKSLVDFFVWGTFATILYLLGCVLLRLIQFRSVVKFIGRILSKLKKIVFKR